MSGQCAPGACAFGRIFVPSSGPQPAPVLLIGEAPGVQELAKGRPFIGPAGRNLDKFLLAARLHRSICRITNACHCLDVGREKKTPLPSELIACRAVLDEEIRLTDPAVIVCLGDIAMQAFFPGYKIGKARGKVRSYHGIPVIATYHPARALPHRNPECGPLIIADLQLAKEFTP